VVNGVRRLTDREMLRLQGFPDTFKINLPYTQARKVAGNSVSVPVIQAIAGEMMNALKHQKDAIKENVQLTLLEPQYEYKRSKASVR
jgi:DNA (cytosine-5)-methyltransferase 1